MCVYYLFYLIIIYNMKDLYLKAIKSYIEMLEIHINTKTVDTTFHKETENFYNTLFDVAHKIWEKYVDLGSHLRNDDLLSQKEKANEVIKNLKKEIEKYKENNETTLWTEDLLWALANSLEDIEWTSRSFLAK